jgi:hypothetical protein
MKLRKSKNRGFEKRKYFVVVSIVKLKRVHQLGNMDIVYVLRKL